MGAVRLYSTLSDVTMRSVGQVRRFFRQRNPLLAAGFAQWLGVLGAMICLKFFPLAQITQPLAIALLQACFASCSAALLGAPRWWWLMHLVFMPLAVVMYGLALPVWVWPAGFFMLLLIFWRTDASQAPLYLTNQRGREALLSLLPQQACRMVDLGCGDGTLLRHLARARPDCDFVGLEHAPVMCAWAWIAARGLPNLKIVRGDFWQHQLEDYAVVYAFLSPAPMRRLWDKALGEMSVGAQLVSNSFPVPEQIPHTMIKVDNSCRACFYRYIPNSGQPI